MKRSPRAESILRALCGEPGPDDGHPSATRPSDRATHKPDRKTWQLCAQVARALEFVLCEACPYALGQTAYVHAVDPAPDATQLLVTIAVRDVVSPADLQLLHTELSRRQGRFREAVAFAITRRKAPSLTFRVITEAALREAGP
jgi:ribosome-binding factor A